MNIAGVGVIPSGEFDEKISISGTGRLSGNLRCKGLSISGEASGAGDIVCDGKMSVAGSAHFKGYLRAETLWIAGSFRLEEGCTAQQDIRVAGAAHFGGAVKCGNLHSDGSIRLDAGAEAEEICLSHRTQSGGLLNAETVTLQLRGGTSCVASIGGSSIQVKNIGRRFSLRDLLQCGTQRYGFLKVEESIEGETVTLENTSAPVVVGDTVNIGKDCEIGRVQYTGQLEIHPEAKVGEVEKL